MMTGSEESIPREVSGKKPQNFFHASKKKTKKKVCGLLLITLPFFDQGALERGGSHRVFFCGPELGSETGHIYRNSGALRGGDDYYKCPVGEKCEKNRPASWSQPHFATCGV